MIGRTGDAEVEVVKVLGSYLVHRLATMPMIGTWQLIGSDARRRYRSGQGQRKRGDCKQFEVCHDGSPSELIAGWSATVARETGQRAGPDGSYNQRPISEAGAPQPSKILFTRLISGRLPNSKALDSIYPTG
jgi:hypothetical protein